MRSFRIVLMPDRLSNLVKRLEVREGRGRWRQWHGPFEETWGLGHCTALIGLKHTQVIDRTGQTQWGRTAQAVYRAA